MKSTLLFGVLMFGVASAFTQSQPADVAVKDTSPESVDAERSRIQSERAREEVAFTQAQIECYQRFAVTDCLNTLRKQRRSALDAWRHQEIKLNDVERKRKAQEQLEQIRQKSLPQ